jgi:L-fucose isomerase-like protein
MESVKIGFVPAHREPFGEDWASKMRKRCLDVFAKIPGLEIVVPDESLTDRGFVRNDADATKVISLFQTEKVEGVIIGAMTFGDEVSALAVANAFREMPIFLFGTKEGPISSDGLRASDSFCGTLSISSGLHRRDIPFVFGGIVFPEEKRLTASILDFMGTCAIVKGFIGASIGLVGPRPERFETCMFSEEAMISKFQQRVVPTGLLDIMLRADKLKKGAPELAKITKEMKKEANMSAVKADTLEQFARLEYALRDFVTEKGLAAMGVQCWNAIQEVYGISACYVLGRLTGSGIMTACEVDIYGALTMLIQNRASLGKVAPHFIDWTIQHQEFKNTFLAWHCGNAPASLSCKGCKPNINSHSILGPTLGKENSMGTGEFELKPGVVTLCRLQEYKGKFKMLVTKGTIIESNQLNRGSWSWVKVPDLDKLYNTLVEHGFVHHASLMHGDYAQPILLACKVMGIETVVV